MKTMTAVLLASAAALEFQPARLQWQAKTRDTTVLLLTETEGAKQTAQAMWPAVSYTHLTLPTTPYV